MLDFGYLALQLFVFKICLWNVPADTSFSHYHILLFIFIMVNSILKLSKRFMLKW